MPLLWNVCEVCGFEGTKYPKICERCYGLVEHKSASTEDLIASARAVIAERTLSSDNVPDFMRKTFHKWRGTP